MLFLKYLLMAGGIGMFLVAVGILTYDLARELQHRRAPTEPGTQPRLAPVTRWRTALAFGLLAWAPIFLALSIIVVPSGMAGIRVSQTSGTLPGTLYPGVHFVFPTLESIALFDTRDQLFTTGSIEDGKAGVTSKGQTLGVQSKEGLSLGLAITVRYRIEPKRLDYIEANLPQLINKIVAERLSDKLQIMMVPSDGKFFFANDVFRSMNMTNHATQAEAPEDPQDK